MSSTWIWGLGKILNLLGALKTSITSYLKTKWAKIGCISLKIKINILALLCPSYPTINKVPVLNWSMFVMQTLKLLLCSLLKHYSLCLSVFYYTILCLFLKKCLVSIVALCISYLLPNAEKISSFSKLHLFRKIRLFWKQ